VTSALGLLFVEPLDDFSWAYVRRSDELDVDEVSGLLAGMEERVADNLRRQGVAASDLVVERAVDMRYVGQLHSVTVPLAEISRAGVQAAVSAFHEEHARQYRYSHPEAPVETSTLRVTARGSRAKPDLETLRHSRRDARAVRDDRHRPVHFEGHGWLETRVVDRSRLVAGEEIAGPCVVEELDGTIVLPPGTSGRVDELGNILIALSYEEEAAG
jgi:N-methylhydantoinase A